MKILHLSDLHLGRKMYHYAFLPQQKKLLKQVVAIAEEHGVQAVLLAGDIYDKNVPVAEAVTVLDEFLTALSLRHIPVFLISGNHDSLQSGCSLAVSCWSISRYILPEHLPGKCRPMTWRTTMERCICACCRL